VFKDFDPERADVSTDLIISENALAEVEKIYRRTEEDMPPRLREAIDEERAGLENKAEEKAVAMDDLQDFGMFLERSSDDEEGPTLGEQVYREVIR
jgi:hypothetical protein